MTSANNLHLYERRDDYIPRVAAVHDLCGYGKCSLGVAIPVLSAAGCDVCPVPTGLFSSHTAFPGWYMHDTTSIMKDYTDAWKGIGVEIDAVYSGFLGAPEQVDRIRDLYETYPNALRVVDPVMGDNGILYSHFDQHFVDEMKGLCKIADVIVPNLTEACFLTDTKYESVTEKDYPPILSKLKKLCPRPSVTGCDEVRDGSVRSAVFYTDEKGELKSYATEKIEGAFHGAGDVYASALVGALARGIDMDKAVELSAEFTKNSIAQTKKDGTEARYGLNSESQMLAFLENIDKAAK